MPARTSRSTDKKGLLPREELFCQEFCDTWNASLAYRKAGYKESNNTATTARKAADLRNKPHVVNRINELLQDMVEDKESLRQKVISELARLAFSDAKNFVEQDAQGNLKIPDLSKLDGHLIKEIKQLKDGRIEFKTWDKEKALEMLGRYLSLFNDKIDVTSKGEKVEGNPYQINFTTVKSKEELKKTETGDGE